MKDGINFKYEKCFLCEKKLPDIYFPKVKNYKFGLNVICNNCCMKNKFEVIFTVDKNAKICGYCGHFEPKIKQNETFLCEICRGTNVIFGKDKENDYVEKVLYWRSE